MKAFKSLDEQLEEVLISLNIDLEKMRPFQLRMKNEKINFFFWLKIDLLFGSHEMSKKSQIKIVSKNDLNDLKSKIISKTKNVNSILEIYEKAKALSEEYVSFMGEQHNHFISSLKEELNIEGMKISSWYNEKDIFREKQFRRFSFFVHQVDSAPADGVLLVLDTNMKMYLDERYISSQNLEYAFRSKKYDGDQFSILKSKVADMEKLQEFMNNFKNGSSPYVLETSKKIINFFSEGAKMYDEIDVLLNTKTK